MTAGASHPSLQHKGRAARLAVFAIWLLGGVLARGMTVSADETPVVKINLLQFESAIGDVDARLTLRLPESALGPRFSVRDDYLLVDEMTIDHSVLIVKANEPFAMLDAILKTRYEVDNAGDQFLYPFDRHRAEIRLFVEKVPTGTSVMTNGVKLPIRSDTTLCQFEGYNVTVCPGPDSRSNRIDLIVDIRRTLPIRIFAAFVVLVMWVVAFGLLAMALKIARSKEVPEVGNLGFAGALLFALPAIRTTQPRVPPMGVLSDYVGFFWAELIVALSLVILVICWITRKNFEKGPDGAPDKSGANSTEAQAGDKPDF